MRLTDRVKQILSWYPSDSPGTKMNLARLLNTGTLAGTGKLVILPVDQGFEHGPARSFAPNPPGYDPEYHVQLAIEAGCNAYAAPLGFLEAIAGNYAMEIPLILKLNNSDSITKGEPASAVTGSVKDAVRLGYEVVVIKDACRGIGISLGGGRTTMHEAHERLMQLGAHIVTSAGLGRA